MLSGSISKQGVQAFIAFLITELQFIKPNDNEYQDMCALVNVKFVANENDTTATVRKLKPTEPAQLLVNRIAKFLAKIGKHVELFELREYYNAKSKETYAQAEFNLKLIEHEKQLERARIEKERYEYQQRAKELWEFAEKQERTW